MGVGAQAREVLEGVADLATSLAPALAAAGIVATDELSVQTLLERMLTEATSTGSVVRSHLQVGAWASV